MFLIAGSGSYQKIIYLACHMLFKSCPVLIFSSLLITWYWQGQLFLPAEVVGNEVFKRKDDEKKKKEVVGNETWLAFINVKLFKAHILFSSSMKPSRMCYGALEPENFVVLSFRCSPTVCSPHIVGYIPPAETAQWWCVLCHFAGQPFVEMNLAILVLPKVI